MLSGLVNTLQVLISKRLNGCWRCYWLSQCLWAFG